MALAGSTIAFAAPAPAPASTSTYLTLTATGPGQNYSNRNLDYDESVTTTFSRVRLVAQGQTVTTQYGQSATCAAIACIDTTDLTYSQSTGSSFFGSTMDYAWAAGCNSPDGTANVNLTGTPYAVAPSAFLVSGSGTVTYSQGGKVVDLTANGGCGDTRSATYPLLPLVETLDNAAYCKNGGWRFLTDNVNPFKNQGDCVSYVATAGKNSANG
jgi:hypothetical protein